MGTSRMKRAEVALRRTQAIEMRARGESWDSIASALGYADRGTACKDVSRALAERLKDQGQAADELREIELEKLDRMERAVVAVLEREHVVVQGGKVVVDPDSGRLRDDGPVLDAVRTLLRIGERRARLLGLDSPVKVDGTTTVRYEITGVDMEALR